MRRLSSLKTIAGVILFLSACVGPVARTPTSAPASPTVLASPTALLSPTSFPTPTALPSATPSPTPVPPVQPVAGLPAGTDGYPWWNDTVFYEVFVRSFYDSDGDGIGDLNGLTAKLDYLKDLGVTGLWLMPIHPSPTYHGYAVTDYYAVNPQYGTMDDLKRLLAEAHKRGIRVMIDFVLNHTSDQHPWFAASRDPDSPYRDWYVWSKTNPDTHWRVAYSGFYYGYFGDEMPDLNYRNPAVAKQMEDVARFWLKDVGVDGFRLDAAKYLIEEDTVIQNSDSTHAWYKQFRSFYKQLNPQAMAVGEVWDISPTAASYAEGDQLDLAFDFSLAAAFLTSARAGRADEALRVFSADYRTFKPLQFATFLSNHDQSRVISQLAGKVEKAKVAAALLLTAPGVPFIYYGEEIGMAGVQQEGDREMRSPMQWTAGDFAGFTGGRPWYNVHHDYAQGVNVADEAADPNSMLSYYRTLIHLRNQHAALRVGGAFLLSSDNPAVFAELRVSQQEAALVVVNLSEDQVTGYHLKLEASPLAGKYLAAPVLGQGEFVAPIVNAQGGFEGYQPLPTVPPYSSFVIQLQSAP